MSGENQEKKWFNSCQKDGILVQYAAWTGPKQFWVVLFEGEIMTEEKIQHNSNCKSDEHTKHLCYMVSQGFNLSDEAEYEELIKNPKFKCRHCGRAANSEDNLCEPAKL